MAPERQPKIRNHTGKLTTRQVAEMRSRGIHAWIVRKATADQAAEWLERLLKVCRECDLVNNYLPVHDVIDEINEEPGKTRREAAHP